MGNIGVTLKRFLGNKNTVTIIGVLAGIAVLYFGYNWRVNQAVQPIPVPFAREAIAGNTEITASMLDTVRVPKSMADNNPNLVRTQGAAIGKFVRYDTSIPRGSLIYDSQLMQQEELPNYHIRNIPEGYTIYALPVSHQSTYGNSIMPNDFIDLYFSAVDEDSAILFGRFIESIQVLAVRDSRGFNVFSSASSGVPSVMLFAVPDDDFQLLRKSDLIRTNNIVLHPVPRNQEYSENPGETRVTSREVVDFINAN